MVLHSLACITALRLAEEISGPIADTVVLVATPYVNQYLLPKYCRPGVETFFDTPFDPKAATKLARQVIWVAGGNDCFCTADQNSAYVEYFGIEAAYTVPEAEHFSPGAGGYEKWRWMETF